MYLTPIRTLCRLPVRSAAAFHLDEQPVKSLNCGELWSESRGAVLGDIEVPGGLSGPLAVYASHLHHNDVEVRSGGELRGGVRRRQASTLLRHWQTREKAVRKAAATFILADFNQPLREHYSEEEWRCVAAGLTHPGKMSLSYTSQTHLRQHLRQHLRHHLRQHLKQHLSQVVTQTPVM